jgi:EEF1A lysine methyltransferase 4
MLHGSLWDPEDDVKQNVGAYIDEVRFNGPHCLNRLTVSQVVRVLKPGGRFLYITYRQPHFLKPLLARPDLWSIQVETLEDAPGSFEYFGFVMSRAETLQ